jgi:ADP-heptose:LPS heptosyltransferase
MTRRKTFVFSHLHIYDPRERVLVGLADAALAPLGWRRARAARAGVAPRRILVLRLERIGDLLMALDAIQDVREAWPDAEIDLTVGSWNRSMAALIPGVTRLDVLDAPWLARDAGGRSWAALALHARGWRRRGYDLAINFEPDIRSNLLAWLSGAPRRAGFWTGGGGALLTDALAYVPDAHVSDNTRRLVAAVRGAAAAAAAPTGARRRLAPPNDALAQADAVIGTSRRPLVGIHASGGREVKQWHLDRFAAVGRVLADTRHATLLLTGAAADRPLVNAIKRQLGDRPVIDVSGALDLPALAALLARLDVFITGDTGPMHVAAAMGTRTVALFGPSDPRRYGPIGDGHRVLRVDLPCSPCGRVRRPPRWCRGHVPACLDGITVDTVVRAATTLLDERRGSP